MVEPEKTLEDTQTMSRQLTVVSVLSVVFAVLGLLTGLYEFNPAHQIS